MLLRYWFCCLWHALSFGIWVSKIMKEPAACCLRLKCQRLARRLGAVWQLIGQLTDWQSNQLTDQCVGQWVAGMWRLGKQGRVSETNIGGSWGVPRQTQNVLSNGERNEWRTVTVHVTVDRMCEYSTAVVTGQVLAGLKDRFWNADCWVRMLKFTTTEFDNGCQ